MEKQLYLPENCFSGFTELPLASKRHSMLFYTKFCFLQSNESEPAYQEFSEWDTKYTDSEIWVATGREQHLEIINVGKNPQGSF